MKRVRRVIEIACYGLCLLVLIPFTIGAWYWAFIKLATEGWFGKAIIVVITLFFLFVVLSLLSLCRAASGAAMLSQESVSKGK